MGAAGSALVYLAPAEAAYVELLRIRKVRGRCRGSRHLRQHKPRAPPPQKK